MGEFEGEQAQMFDGFVCLTKHFEIGVLEELFVVMGAFKFFSVHDRSGSI